jgi:hypothetical protein
VICFAVLTSIRLRPEGFAFRSARMPHRAVRKTLTLGLPV